MEITILIVEDEASDAEYIELMLKKMGYGVSAIVSGGKEAIGNIAQTRPNLALMSIKLGGEKDGIQAAQEIEDRFDVPVVYISAPSGEGTLQHAELIKPFGYVQKPIQSRELRTTIEMALYLHASEKKLRESEEQYRTILRTSLDGFFVFDSNGHLLDVNDAYCQMSGYTRDELIQMSIQDLEGLETPGEIAQHIQKIISVGWDRFETRHRRKEGSLFDVEINVNYIPQQKRGYAFLHDMTERVQTENKILKLNENLKRQAHQMMMSYQAEREQRELAETLMETSEVLVSTLNVDVVLDRILEQINRIVKYDVCNIMLIEGDRTHVVRSRGYEDFDAGSFIETFVFPLSGLSIRRQIIETGEPIVVPDVNSDPRWMAPVGAAWLRSYVAVPIRVQNKVTGFINIGISMPGFYNQAHVKRLQAFAHQAAIAFQNAHLFEETQQNATRLQVLSQQLLNVQESERRYIARELHDEVGQTLTATKLSLQAVLRYPEATAYRGTLEECISIIELALQQVRDITLILHPSVLDDLGLLPALRWCVDREAQWGGFTAEIIADSFDKRLPGNIELVCYRVAQEALTNISRHAHAKHVTAELWQRGAELHLIVRDDGVGFNVKKMIKRAIRGSSLGLLGMQERVKLVNGQIEINSTSGNGTEIHVRIPLEAYASRTGELV